MTNVSELIALYLFTTIHGREEGTSVIVVFRSGDADTSAGDPT